MRNRNAKLQCKNARVNGTLKNRKTLKELVKQIRHRFSKKIFHLDSSNKKFSCKVDRFIVTNGTVSFS